MDMDDTLTFMTFERVKDSYSDNLREYDTIVTAQDNPDDWGMVYFRPYVRTFLEAVSKVFEVVVLTATCKEYADQILNAIDPEKRLIHHRLYRDSCQECIANPSIPESKVYVKDLRVLGRNLSDVILIDNSLLCFSYQLDNGIVCNPFKGASDDTELLTILEVLSIVNRNPGADVTRLFKKMYGLSSIIAEYSSKGGRSGIKRHPTGLDELLDSPIHGAMRLADLSEPDIFSPTKATPRKPHAGTPATSARYPKSGLRVSGRHEHIPLDIDDGFEALFPKAPRPSLAAAPAPTLAAPPIFINTILPRMEPISTPIHSIYSSIINSNNFRQSLAVNRGFHQFEPEGRKEPAPSRNTSVIRE